MVQPAHRRGAAHAATGCSGCTRTVQRTIPETVRRPRPHTYARGRCRRAGRRPTDEYFAALPDAWMRTGEQRARLSPAVETALSSGWTPAALAAFTGANTEGVRSPYAVLTARLSPAEVPPPPGRRPARPPWCGQCDQATRMLGFDGDAPRPCPRCKPAATASRASPAPPLARARPRSSAPPLYCGHRL
jgi:hypothetical protein